MNSYSSLLQVTGGVFRTAQLRATGATPSQIRSAVLSGGLGRIRSGWLHAPDAAPDLIRAVALGGRLACVSAARHLGLWTLEHDTGLHIARPAHAGRTYGDASSCVEHWQSRNWSASPTAVESIPQLVRQVLLCCEYEDALCIIDSALHQRRMSVADLTRVVASLPPRFARVLDDIDPASESGLETLCRYRLRRLGIRIRSQVAFVGIGRVDLILGDRVVLEADGRETHEESFIADRTRDLALMRRGHLVVRVGYRHVVHEWELVEQTVRAVVNRGEHRWSAAHRREGLVA